MGERIDLTLFGVSDQYQYPTQNELPYKDQTSFHLDETYRVVKVIGKGGFALVYEVRDKHDNSFAVKRITRSKQGIPCLMEASIMASYQHPHLSLAKKIEVLEGELYILQDVAKCDLERWRSINTPTREKVKLILFSVIQALNFLHGEGIIDGDVKSTNVLVYSHNDFRLADFNLTSMKKWRSDLHICTASHRPIEGWEGHWDESVDIWSLGCLAYQLIIGRKLFVEQERPNDKQRAKDAILDWEDYLSGRKINGERSGFEYTKPQISSKLASSDDLITLVKSMLQVDKEKRPTISQLVSHPLFTSQTLVHGNINRLSLLKKKGRSKKVILVDKPNELNILHPIKHEEIEQSSDKSLYDHIKTPSVREIAEQIHRRYIKEIVPRVVERQYLVATITWMAGKLVREDRSTCYRQHTISKGLNYEKIYEMERDICRTLKFMLH